MKEVSGRQYWVDTTDSLVLRAAPSWDRPVSVGMPTTAEEKLLHQEQERVRTALVDINFAGRSVDKALHIFRRTLYDLYLPEPGMITLPDGFCTGWIRCFYKGTIYTAFRKMPDEPVYRTTASPFFMLNQEQRAVVDLAIQNGPVSDDIMQMIHNAPSVSAHPQYKRLQSMPAYEHQVNLRQDADRIWQNFPSQQSADHIRGAYVRDHILELAVHRNAAKVAREKILRTIITMMNKSRTTVFAITPEVCVVCYSVEGALEYRIVPMPSDKIPLFQRLGGAKQIPLTKREFDEKYARLVGK